MARTLVLALVALTGGLIAFGLGRGDDERAAPATTRATPTVSTTAPTTPPPQAEPPVAAPTIPRTRTSTAPPPAASPPRRVRLVPNVVGLRVDAATARLRRAGFSVSSRAQTVSDPGRNRIVLRQFPAPRTRLPRGAVVTVVVGALS